MAATAEFETEKSDFICGTLILALMRLPATDFQALSYLIPVSAQSYPKVEIIQKCADLLERCVCLYITIA